MSLTISSSVEISILWRTTISQEHLATKQLDQPVYRVGMDAWTNPFIAFHLR